MHSVRHRFLGLLGRSTVSIIKEFRLPVTSTFHTLNEQHPGRELGMQCALPDTQGVVSAMEISIPLQVKCRKRLAEGGTVVSTYSKVGFQACGEVGERAVDTLVVVSQGSCCIAYLIFISQNLTSIVCRPSYPSAACLSGATFVLLGAPFQVAHRTLKFKPSVTDFLLLAFELSSCSSSCKEYCVINRVR